VYATRQIGGTWFGIVATDAMSRTLARVEHGAWKLLREVSVRMPERIARPVEVWMRSPAGDVYQAFYFGPSAPRRVVVWWHGGPTESVSPRFNPYFHR
jgi:dipeptidyl aminopeptidase/acylaminoacyl peptidase